MNDIAMLRDYLARNALRNIAPLKSLERCPGDCAGYTISEHGQSGALAIIDNASSDFDRQTYPEAAFSVFIDASHPRITELLIEKLPTAAALVFKLSHDQDEAVVRNRFELVRTTSFLSFTAALADTCLERAYVTTVPGAETLSIFEEQGHSPTWVKSAMADQRGFVVEKRVEGALKAACFAIQIFENIWEIGGVYTDPRSRRQGLARHVVETALARLAHLKHQVRYQVQETNVASIALARSLKLQHYLTVTHFVSCPSGPGE